MAWSSQRNAEKRGGASGHHYKINKNSSGVTTYELDVSWDEEYGPLGGSPEAPTTKSGGLKNPGSETLNVQQDSAGGGSAGGALSASGDASHRRVLMSLCGFAPLRAKASASQSHLHHEKKSPVLPLGAAERGSASVGIH